MENILKKLLVPDNAILNEATAELKAAFKDDNVYKVLCEVLSSSEENQVRQYAAVLLRNRFSRSKRWNDLPVQLKNGIKSCVLQRIVSEEDKVVRSSIAQLIGTISKYELKNDRWPEMMTFLQQSIKSVNSTERELGMLTLQTVTAVSAEHMRPDYRSLLLLFSSTLDDNENINVPVNTIKILKNLASQVGSDEVKLFQNLIPKCLRIVKYLVTTDEELARESIDLFDELFECEVSIIVPYIKTVVEACLEISKNREITDETRIRAMTLISLVTRLKNKTILKHKLISPIVDVLFPIMCESSPEDESNDEDAFLVAEAQTAGLFAAQVLDIMALYLPPEKLLNPLLKYVEPAIVSDDPLRIRAGYICLAVVAEGCSDYIRKKYLKSFLQCICKGIGSDRLIIKNSSLFALGQFSEHLQPDVSEYASEILPLLFEYLSFTCQQLINGAKDPQSLTKTFYALETFCENLDDKLLPYLPVLMERLLTFLSGSTSVRVRELSISAIGAAANAAKGNMVPFFTCIVDHIKSYLTETQSEETMPLQIQSLDTLGVLARTIGVDNFKPYAHECMSLGLKLLEDADDPDLRRCTYGLFASISTVLGEEMNQYMEDIIDMMIISLKSTEGVIPQYSDDANSSFVLFDNLDDDDSNTESIELKDDEEDDDRDDVAGYSVENAYVEEKEDACCALRELAAQSCSSFVQYLDLCFPEVMKMLEHPVSDVRKAAVDAVCQFCLSLYKVSASQNNQNGIQAFQNTLQTVIPKFSSIISDDSERNVVMSALESFTNILNTCGEASLTSNEILEIITSSVKQVMLKKISCQDNSDRDDDPDSDDEAEYDTMLIEYAGEVVPALAKVVPIEKFNPYFAGFLPHFIARTRKGCSVAEKSFAIGTLAEVVEAVRDGIFPFIQHLFQVFQNGMKDLDDEVRSNSVFGLGLLIRNSGDVLHSQYPFILQALSRMLFREDNPKAMDNICGAIARLILSNVGIVPVKEVLPVLLSKLPLKEDFEENAVIYECMAFLISIKHAQFFSSLPVLLDTITKVFNTKQIKEETRMLIVRMVRELNQNHYQELTHASATLNQESVQILSSIINAV